VAAEEHRAKLSYTPFPGIVHTDTFTMQLDKKLVDDTNSKRAKKQKETPITVIIGNPPYSIGQRSANDNNQNTKYEQLDERIQKTYAASSSAALQRNLYDSYIRAFRWASDRIGDKGVVCYVSNGGYIDGNAMDGFRKCLTEDFTDIYVYNLRGGIRGRQGDDAKKEGQNVFPIMTGVAVTLLIKNPKKQGCAVHYHDIGDYLNREEKLKNIANAEGLQGIPWQTVKPNEKHDWINQRGEVFDSFISLGAKRDNEPETFFDTFAIGVATNRDSWCWNFSQHALKSNMTRMIEFYNEQVKAYKECKEWDKEITVEQFVDTDPKKISWTRALRNDARKSTTHSFCKNAQCKCLYRPFAKQWLYYDRPFIESPGIWSQIFPDPEMKNVTSGVLGRGSTADFCALVSDTIPDLHLFGAGQAIQCFPLYTYEKTSDTDKKGAKSLVSVADGGERIGNYIRRENISDAMLQKFRERYKGDGRQQMADGGREITKEDIFYYVYGILHSRSYRERFASDLKKQLPRIPLVDNFWAFSKAGRKLGELHVNYETGEMYPLEEKAAGGRKQEAADYRVVKMKFPSKTDKSKIIYNDSLTLEGIPPETFRYVVNGKSALEWVMERYAVTTHKDSGIVNDPNDWCKETGNERYIVDLIKRIVRLSVESVKVIEGLPKVEF
jgi:predicted helicase